MNVTAKQRRAAVNPLPQTDVNNIQLALNDLRGVRDRLHFAGADKAAESVARAMKSVEGALRHANAKLVRATVYGDRQYGGTP